MSDYLLLAQQVAAVQDATGKAYPFDEQIRELGRERDEAQDKALRFDLDQVGIESRERDAVELVDLRAKCARLERGIVALGEEVERERQRYENMRAEYGKLEDATVAWMQKAKDRDALRAENARLLSALAQAHIDLGSEVNDNDCECDDCVRFRAITPATETEPAPTTPSAGQGAETETAR